MEIENIIDFLKNYSGPAIRIMEVCGSHTQAISKSGIRDMISKNIQLISGPGCPVCVTPTDYIDKLIELSLKPGVTVCTFGDLLRVPGSATSLNEAKGQGATAIMVYSPMDVLSLAKEHPEETYVFAAVGFETTAPVYTILLDEIIKENIPNIKLLTALKTMPEAISYLAENEAKVDGFIAPGHVCAITGADYFKAVGEKYGIPFAVSGFKDKELIIAIYGLVQMVLNHEVGVKNYYTSVVESKANKIAMDNLDKYFMKADAAWRGMGIIAESGLVLRPEYEKYDAGSCGLNHDNARNKACRCGEVLMGKIKSEECPLFAKVCEPMNPQGACMVSMEGSCFSAYNSRR